MLLFAQVGLRLDEVCLELSPGLFRLQVGAPDSALFLEIPCLCVQAVGNVDELSLCDGIACRGCVINTLV